MRRLLAALSALLLLAAFAPAAQEALVGLKRVVRHRDARALEARVREELGPLGALRLDLSANALAVRDEAARVERVRGLLQMLDVPARRFALEAEFGVYERPLGAGLLLEPADRLDATPWLRAGRVARSAAAVLDVTEGGRAEVKLLPGFTLRAAAEGYDPTRRTLAFSELALAAPSGPPLLSGRGNLPEGEATVFYLAPAGSDRYRLSLRPVLVPNLEEGERR